MKYHRHKHTSKKVLQTEKKVLESQLETINAAAYTLSTDANGIAKLEDGSIVFIKNLLPNEKAQIKIHTKKSTYKRASVAHRENDSEHRTTPPCEYYSVCGGCQIQHIKTEKQFDFKIQWFFETLKRIGKWNQESIVAAEKKISFIYLKTDHYRRRIRLHFDGKNLGFREQESRNIVSIDSCYIARPKLNSKIQELKNNLILLSPELKKIANSTQIEFDIEMTETDEEKIVLNFVNINPHSQKTLEAIHKYFHVQEDQLIQIRHPKIGKFKIKKESFIQPHFNSIESYYENISRCVDTFVQQFIKRSSGITHNSTIRAWDLYAGSGIFSCIPYFSSKKFGLCCECLAVEGIPEAIDSLKLNLHSLPIQGVVQDVHEFIENQFAQMLQSQLESNQNASSYNKTNIIILDPPRAGVGIPNMQKIIELCAPVSCVLYLACDPASFSRDSQILLEGGFQNKHIFLFDSFGQTNFYEVLGFFTRGI